MYIAILKTYYEIYAIGGTEEEAKRNIVKGYKDMYRPEERTIERPTYEKLNEYFGCGIYRIDDKKGYTHE